MEGNTWSVETMMRNYVTGLALLCAEVEDAAAKDARAMIQVKSCGEAPGRSGNIRQQWQ